MGELSVLLLKASTRLKLPRKEGLFIENKTVQKPQLGAGLCGLSRQRTGKWEPAELGTPGPWPRTGPTTHCLPFGFCLQVRVAGPDLAGGRRDTGEPAAGLQGTGAGDGLARAHACPRGGAGVPGRWAEEDGLCPVDKRESLQTVLESRRATRRHKAGLPSDGQVLAVPPPSRLSGQLKRAGAQKW